MTLVNAAPDGQTTWRDLIMRVWGEDPQVSMVSRHDEPSGGAVAARQTATKERPWSAAEGERAGGGDRIKVLGQ